MAITALLAALAVGSGGMIGLTLGLVGGGGSILAVPCSSIWSESHRRMSRSARPPSLSL